MAQSKTFEVVLYTTGVSYTSADKYGAQQAPAGRDKPKPWLLCPLPKGGGRLLNGIHISWILVCIGNAVWLTPFVYLFFPTPDHLNFAPYIPKALHSVSGPNLVLSEDICMNVGAQQ